jgi:tetratricopeptide (TPR) repeat protein
MSSVTKNIHAIALGLWALGALTCAAAADRNRQVAPIQVDYPAEGSLFPPDFTAPVFRWRDSNPANKSWRVEVSFGGRKAQIKVKSDGSALQVGEIDQRAVSTTNRPPVLSQEEAAGHTWTPDEKTWAEMKKRSVEAPATITITGFDDPRQKQAASRGQVTIRTSIDPVGAPIFYRDVPLIPSEGKKGIISPIPKHALGLIAWRLRDVSKPESRLLMTGVSTCVNCHSFSSDGKTLGLDVDGPDNDRGLYALMHVSRETQMRSQDLVMWRTFTGPLGGSLRIGFMSQVSPDGKYVLTTINDPKSNQSQIHKNDIIDRYYVTNFLDYKFIQVFYPTRGILAWYSRETGKLQPLPGADDERYVQATGFWSPDQKYVVFARAEARSAYPEGYQKPEFANDPSETQIQYDLYRIPFNEGRGGKAEPLAGASQNGMSNNFPKVSPDGKWIVFVQCKNGLLMRPDSKLYIVPAEGGTARPLKCNTALMNSWHSFSPNGRWLVFSSKARSPYTQMYLTHIDENGDDSPALLVDNSTAANRGVNIPEFVNIPQDSWEKMEAPMADFFQQLTVAIDLVKEKKVAEAIPEFRKAVAMAPDDSRAHYNLGVALRHQGQIQEAVAELRKAIETDPTSMFNPKIYVDLGLALSDLGQLDEAQRCFEKALEDNPLDAEAHTGLGTVLCAKGRMEDGLAHCRKALEIDPNEGEAHNMLGIALAKAGKLTEATAHLRRAAELRPQSFECQFNLGRVLAAGGEFAEALGYFKSAVDLTAGKDFASVSMLAAMYSEVSRWSEAIEAGERAVRLAEQAGDRDAAEYLKEKLVAWRSRAQPGLQ